MSKTNAERCREYRKRKATVTVWLEVTPGDEPLLRDCAALLRGEGREYLTEWLKIQREKDNGR